MGDVRNPAATVRSAIPNRFHSKLWVHTIKLDGDESVLRDQVYQPEAAEDDDLVLNDEQPMRVAYSAIGKRHTEQAAYTAKYPQKQAQAVSSLRPHSAAGACARIPGCLCEREWRRRLPRARRGWELSQATRQALAERSFVAYNTP